MEEIKYINFWLLRAEIKKLIKEEQKKEQK